jgi:biotin transport system substrate-specific component
LNADFCKERPESALQLWGNAGHGIVATPDFAGTAPPHYLAADHSFIIRDVMHSALRLQSNTFSGVDALREEHATTAVQVLGIVGFALLTALGAQFKIFLWEVPVSLQTLAMYGSGLYLGWRNGMIAQLLYLTLGMFLPVFAGDTFGPAYFFLASSAGYLIAFPFAAAAVGLLSRRWNALGGSVLSLLVGSAIVFTIGVTWLHFAAGHASWLESIDKGWLRFVTFDLLKIAAIAAIYAGTRRIF